MTLKALPATPYQFAEWKKCRAAPDYHVEIADHYYSVPSRLIREQLEARMTDTTIEILHKGVRVASHARSHARRRHTTIPEHMPSAHRRYAEWTCPSWRPGIGVNGRAALLVRNVV